MKPEHAARAVAAAALMARPLERTGHDAIGLAHEVSTLLAGINGDVGALAVLAPEQAHVPATLLGIVGDSQQGAAMIRRLISYARQEAVHTTTVPLHEVVAALPDRVCHHLDAAHRFRADCESGPVAVNADAAALDDVLLHLVLNARDAMPDGGTLRVSVRRALREGGVDACGTEIPAGAYVTITVRDTGCGVDAAVQARMFDPFFTTKPFGKGAGLGLAMCYTLVRQVDGFIEVASTPNMGTSVIVSLPDALPLVLRDDQAG